MAKARSTNNSGNKYKHNHTTVLKTDSGTVIRNRDTNQNRNIPRQAEPGDTTYISLTNNNAVKQIRNFNELTGEPTKDIDLDHDHGKGQEHAHDWVDGKRQGGRALFEDEKEIVEQAKQIEVPEKSLRYYEIDEKLAERALKSYSFSDYKKDNATNNYRESVDEAFDYADKIKETNPEYAEKAQYLADLYAKKYADWINKKNKIDTLVPSAMIVGPGNFPTRKKEKQNAMRDKHFQEYDKIAKIKDDIKWLEHQKPREEKQGKAVEGVYNFDNKYFKVEQNEELNRLQLKFEGKPSAEMRDKLKHNGFRYSPTNNAWQRQLTPNARYATSRLIKQLDEEDKKE